MKLVPILKLSLKHGYYENGLCSDFEVVPDNTTKKLLINHRCIVKTVANGVEIYTEIDGTGKPAIQFSTDILRFYLKLSNREFLLFTDAAALANGLNYQISYPSQPSDYYALIEIHGQFNETFNNHVEILFAAKAVRWIYYLITDPGNPADDFSVVSQDPQFTWKQETSSESVFLKLADQYQDSKRLRFISEQSISCRESGLQHIQLLLGGNTVIESLPNPSWRNYFQTEIATGETVDAIYQIVKYLTNTTLLKV